MENGIAGGCGSPMGAEHQPDLVRHHGCVRHPRPGSGALLTSFGPTNSCARPNERESYESAVENLQKRGGPAELNRVAGPSERGDETEASC